MCFCLSCVPHWDTPWPTAQPCALTGNLIGHPLVCRPVNLVKPLSHMSHAKFSFQDSYRVYIGHSFLKVREFDWRWDICSHWRLRGVSGRLCSISGKCATVSFYHICVSWKLIYFPNMVCICVYVCAYFNNRVNILGGIFIHSFIHLTDINSICCALGTMLWTGDTACKERDKAPAAMGLTF